MKDEHMKTIEVVFEGSCAKYGSEIIKWLQDDGIAELSYPPEETESGFAHYTLAALRQIATDSMIVFVSDEATANRDWFSCVNSVSEKKRVIPAGATETVDYNDPEVIPPRIEEINFIRIDENLRKNLIDSLTTDPEFYSVKNRLLMRCRCWAVSHDTMDLLTNLKEIKEYTSIAKRKLENENDSSLRAQLNEIIEYLEASRKYAKKILVKDIGRWTARGIVILVAVGMLVGFFAATKYYRRLSYANLASSLDVDSVDAQSGAIKMAEVLSNPYSYTTSKKLAFQNLVELMDTVWPQTPVGRNYKNSINDVAIPSGGRYVWTADSGGRIICWDTYTGATEKDIKLCEAEAVNISVSKSDKVFAALDGSGRIYTFAGDDWRDSGAVSQADIRSSVLKVTDDTILIFDKDSFELFDLNGNPLSSGEHPDCRILDIDFLTDSEILIAESKDGILKTVRFDFTNDRSESAGYDSIKTGSLSEADIYDGLLVVSDENGQVWKIADNEASKTALCLPKTIRLKLIDRATVIYHERNTGTGVYDIEDGFDYGDILSDIRGINELYVSDSLVAAGGASGYNIYPIDKLLKTDKTKVQLSADEVVYDRSEYETDRLSENQTGVQSVKITSNGVILLRMKLSDTDGITTAVLDPARVFINSSGRSSLTDDPEIPEDALQYDSEPFYANDLPVAAGIRHEPADELHDTECFYVVIGCKDGSFAELAVDNTGVIVRTVSHTVPSRSAIKAIHQVGNGYVLEDSAGRLWQCDDGTELTAKDGYIQAIKDKMHAAATDELKALISPELWEALELRTFRGGADELWE